MENNLQFLIDDSKILIRYVKYMKVKMEEIEKKHASFLKMAQDELFDIRKSCKRKYNNLSKSSICSSVIVQTLQELQILKEFIV